MTEQTAEDMTASMTEADVAAFLEQHPDFFERHEQLLHKLKLPHDSGNAISLVERQVHLFREQRDSLREELSGLIAVARQNDQLFARSKRLLLQLLEAQSLEEVAAILDESMREEFGLSGASLVVFDHAERSPQRGALRYLDPDEAHSVFEHVLEQASPVFGRLRESYKQAAFSSPEQVGSAAIIPVGHPKSMGLIAISSDQEHYFDSSMGSLFLSYISDTLSRLLPPLINAPATQGSDESEPL